MTALTTPDAADGRRAPDVEAPTLATALAHRRVKTDKQDLPVQTMIDWVLHGILIPQPPFQRSYVWDRGKASRLIESLVLQIPIPVIYVAEEAERTYVVVDGQQRLSSIVAYFTGTFPDGKAFRLTGLSVLRELQGQLFKELPRTCQQTILTAILRVIILTQDSDPEVKFDMFERLNLGAVQLTDQELRNSMYRGTYNALLHELATHPTLLTIRRATHPHPRMADRQLVLRFFAMWHQTHLKYTPPMKHFLNRDMAAYRTPSSEDLEAMRAVFDKAITLAYSVFGTNAFRRFNPGEAVHPHGLWETRTLNVALWDTVLYSFSFYEKRQIIPLADAIVEEFLDLLTHDKRFVAYITSSTDNMDRVIYRADTWRQRLQQLVDSPEPRRFSRALKQQWYDADPTCGLCGQHMQGLDDAEADHILHYWRGGRTLPDNGRLVHRYCNRARGGRV